jgi:hypothetical protein
VELRKCKDCLLLSSSFCLFVNFDRDMIGLIVSQGECPSHNPECNRVIERGPALNGDYRARDETHFTEALTKDTTDLH